MNRGKWKEVIDKGGYDQFTTPSYTLPLEENIDWQRGKEGERREVVGVQKAKIGEKERERGG